MSSTATISNPIQVVKDIRGKWMVLSPTKKVAQSGGEYWAFRLENDNSSYAANAWLNECRGVSELEEGMTLHITGRLMKLYRNYYIECSTLVRSEAPIHTSERSLVRLRALYRLINSRPLQAFMESLLEDVQLREKWISIPASKRNHHAWPGGLFQHSIEAAWNAWLSDLDIDQRELTAVAALVHDIGKVMTHNQDGSFSPYVCIDHEVLGFEVLAPHFQVLDSHCRETALNLRRLLSFNLRRHHSQISLDETVVRHSDQISAALSLHDKHGW